MPMWGRAAQWRKAMSTRAGSEGHRTRGAQPMPSERTNPDLALHLSDEQCDLLARTIREGDPLADAVIKELDALGPESVKILDAGLRNGLASLPTVPPAIEALLRAAETIPEWVEPDILERRCEAYLSIEPLWQSIAGD